MNEKSTLDRWHLQVLLVFVVRPFLRWVQAQGRSPDTLGIPQNASGSICISLKRGATYAMR